MEDCSLGQVWTGGTPWLSPAGSSSRTVPLSALQPGALYLPYHQLQQTHREEFEQVRQGRREQTAEAPLILTWVASVEVVVILRDIRQDTEAVRNPKGHHVFCIQQSWNSQLLLCNLEGLQTTSTLSNRTGETLGGLLLFFLLESRSRGQKTEMDRCNHIKSTV